MSSGQGELRDRTKSFALRVIHLVRRLGKDDVSSVISKQVLRSGTSVGAQYREAYRARSAAEFVSKVESAAQEMDETLYWFELLSDAEVIPAAKLSGLMDEGKQILAMLSASARTAKAAKGNRK
ncbi:MAG: four helix bundle protein [Planctomycetota bacterium]